MLPLNPDPPPCKVSVLPAGVRILAPWVRWWPAPGRVYVRDLDQLRRIGSAGRLARAQAHAGSMAEVGQARWLRSWFLDPQFRAMADRSARVQEWFASPALFRHLLTRSLISHAERGYYPASGLFR
jgi:hypothetical protein